MRPLPCSTLTIVLTVILALTAFGCAPSRDAQCKSVIQIANGAVEEAKKLTNGGQTNEPQAMLQAADAMEQAAEGMKALELTDEQLQTYQNGFIEMYAQTAEATRNFVDAFEKKDRPRAEAALANLQRATQPEQELVQGINTYCQGN
ncbi:hypothetical protein K4A83_22115 [Spirulina subsalsa FACHB-351]|uniref:Lipoprotein n=1 Tax=Spirulina subsalsa FACHB-351 TaxID=234711 RepID=A0ABT3LBN4_9CYAN|nr:hypothetical protein [Spirulina subsalsa]MCW6038926.1 hypothetical protein [Spirulina subsalsa FACHB-351]